MSELRRRVLALYAEADAEVAAAGPVCVGTDAENSFFGDGVVDALDAVS